MTLTIPRTLKYTDDGQIPGRQRYTRSNPARHCRLLLVAALSLIHVRAAGEGVKMLGRYLR